MVSCWADYADCVAVDDQAGIGLAVEHLAGLGHERIGYVGQPLMEATTGERARWRSSARCCAAAWHRLASGAERHADFVAPHSRGDGPTALVAATDHIAVA